MKSLLRVLVVVMAWAVGSVAASAAGSSPAGAAFDVLKGLAGTWRGTVVSPDGPAAEVQYRVASGGTVVMETLFPGTDHEMITMYRMRGDDLIGTHYCAMGNQPRFRLQSADDGRLVFAFDGGDNLDPDVSVHVHEGEIVIKDADTLEATWVVHQNGQKAGQNQFFLQRVKSID